MVLFDGPNSFMVNKLSGEVNWINDDGHNYTMDMWIVPPDEVSAVAQEVGFAGPAP
jgi:hypothetical protein